MYQQRQSASDDVSAMSSSGDAYTGRPVFQPNPCQPRFGGCCPALRVQLPPPQPEISCTSSDVSCCLPAQPPTCSGTSSWLSHPPLPPPPGQPCFSRQTSGVSSEINPLSPLSLAASLPPSWLSLAQPNCNDPFIDPPGTAPQPPPPNEEPPPARQRPPPVSSLCLFNRQISPLCPAQDLLRLPDTCLLRICSKLPSRADVASLSATCRRLLSLSSHSLSSLHLTKRPEDSVFVRILHRFPSLRSLTVSAPNSHALFSDWHVTLVASRNLPLASLTLENQTLLSDTALAALATAHPALHLLNLNGCVGLSDRALSLIAEGCRTLREFRMCYCRRVTLVGLRQLCGGCPNLRLLELSDMNGLEGQWNKLKELVISCDACECPATLSSVPATCPSLTTLALRFCCRVNEKLDIIRATSTLLSSLRLESCTDIPPTLFRHGWPHLTDLCVSSCGIVDDVLTAIGEGCPNLTTVRLQACAELSDIRLLDLVQRCKSLRVIDVKNSPRITHSVLVSLTTRRDLRVKRIVLPRQCFGAKHLRVVYRNQWDLDTTTPSWQLVKQPEKEGR